MANFSEVMHSSTFEKCISLHLVGLCDSIHDLLLNFQYCRNVNSWSSLEIALYSRPMHRIPPRPMSRVRRCWRGNPEPERGWKTKVSPLGNKQSSNIGIDLSNEGMTLPR